MVKDRLTAEDFIVLPEVTRTITWTEIPTDYEFTLLVENYKDTPIVNRGGVRLYKIVATAMQDMKALWVLKGERVVFSLPATAMGDKIFYGLRFNNLLDGYAIVKLHKNGERLGKVLSVSSLATAERQAEAEKQARQKAETQALWKARKDREA